ncbi:DUF2147 domain-containing protein [Halieaceae bacterium IMCC14734]|uniref:DUF2147 domain-containing protein n=1 Tax=Candidatus Litorirhabdus singularis TaxID=2518993 RepID=A0ABT3TFF0_9GAMM|nr:hypothetical protein [Candidatus Litorirhabdus singularis]MCX2980925.1 DUF2147 domain-containing protein [Candidatus Litorirhabdus singularis]
MNPPSRVTLSRLALLLLCFMNTAAFSSDDLVGFWQHTEQPAWIEVRFDSGQGEGTVVRNDVYTGRVGTVLLKNLVAVKDKQWQGEVYAEKFGEYKQARISLSKPDVMGIKVKVGFMSRTIEMRRVSAVPES